MKYHNMLVIADRPEDQPDLAIQRAIAIAEPDANIMIVAFVHDAMLEDDELNEPAKVEHYKQQLIDQRNVWLDELLAAHASEHVRLQGEVVWSKDISDWIQQHSKQQPYDLVIKTGNRTENFWYTPTDWRLLRECEVPVYIGSRNAWRSQAVILATVDIVSRNAVQMELNHKVMDHAQRMSVALGATLHLAYAVPVSQLMLDLEAFDKSDYLRRFQKRHEDKLHAFAREYGIDKHYVHVKAGPPQKIVPRIANDLKAELVVLGASGQRGLLGKMLGGTVEQTMHILRTDVLSVRP
ncbi:MAG: universal stress protein [Gammaproteobacteria bacterium]|nr:universal stress protein [Gammaproteobacteria bacterium]